MLVVTMTGDLMIAKQSAGVGDSWEIMEQMTSRKLGGWYGTKCQYFLSLKGMGAVSV